MPGIAGRGIEDLLQNRLIVSSSASFFLKSTEKQLLYSPAVVVSVKSYCQMSSYVQWIE